MVLAVWNPTQSFDIEFSSKSSVWLRRTVFQSIHIGLLSIFELNTSQPMISDAHASNMHSPSKDIYILARLMNSNGKIGSQTHRIRSHLLFHYWNDCGSGRYMWYMSMSINCIFPINSRIECYCNSMVTSNSWSLVDHDPELTKPIIWPQNKLTIFAEFCIGIFLRGFVTISGCFWIKWKKKRSPKIGRELVSLFFDKFWHINYYIQNSRNYRIGYIFFFFRVVLHLWTTFRTDFQPFLTIFGSHKTDTNHFNWHKNLNSVFHINNHPCILNIL